MLRSARIVVRRALLFAVLAGSPVGAQKAPEVGELVEARIVGPGDPLLGHFCRAWLGAVAGDTLLLNRSESCRTGAHVARLRVHTDDRGSRLNHAGVGLLVGAVVGGVIGRVSAGDGCPHRGGCEEGGFAIGVITLAGTVTGALVGVVSGALLPAGRRWVDLPGERPIRVGSLDLHPAIRVSVRERRR